MGKRWRSSRDESRRGPVLRRSRYLFRRLKSLSTQLNTSLVADRIGNDFQISPWDHKGQYRRQYCGAILHRLEPMALGCNLGLGYCRTEAVRRSLEPQKVVVDKTLHSPPTDSISGSNRTRSAGRRGGRGAIAAVRSRQ
jgi:hypothetical protein